MEQLNKTPITGKFGDVAKVLDTNFGLIVTKLMELSKAKKMNCGFYSSETELKTAYPNPDKGMVAYVGGGTDYTVYRCKTDGTWTATSETFKVTVDLSTYATKDALAQVKGSVDSLLLGAVYGGIAARTTNPGTPNVKVFYLPTEVGEYPNFGNLSVVENEIAFLYYDGTNWTKQSIDFSNDFNDINDKFSDLHANILHPIRGKNFFNKQEVSTHVDGYVSESGNIISNSSWSTFICRVESQKNYIVNGSNIRVAFFNEKSFISYITSSNKFTTPENCNIAKISVLNVLLQDADNFIVNEGDVLDVSSTYWETYVTKEQLAEVETKLDSHIQNVEVNITERVDLSTVVKDNYVLNKETGEFEASEGNFGIEIPLKSSEKVIFTGTNSTLYYVLVNNGIIKLPAITSIPVNYVHTIDCKGYTEIRITSDFPDRIKSQLGAILLSNETSLKDRIDTKVDKVYGKNIFNCYSKENLAGWSYDGYTINSEIGKYKENGEIDETGFFTSYYISVKPNTTYSTSFATGSDNTFIFLYDKNKKKLRTINDQSKKFTTGNEEVLMRITGRNILYKLSIEEGDTATENTPYEDYVLLSKKEYDDFVYKSSILSGLKIVAHLADWEGKNVAGYGDSITELQEESEDGVATSGWLKTVGDYFGFNKRYNRGIGGTTIRNYNKEITVKVNPNGGNKNYGVPDEQKVTCCQAMCSWSRIKAQFPEEIKDTIDLVLFMGGTNDFGGVGDIGDGILPKWSSENNYDDEWMADNVYNPEHGDFPQNTFKGSIASTILKLQRWMPYARIVIVTQLSGRRKTVEGGMTDFCYDSHDKSPYDYTRDAIMVAEMMSTPYIDLFRTCGINQFNSTLFIQDIVHPSASNSSGKRNGVSSLARSIIGGLKNILPISRESNDNSTYE